MSVIYTFFVRLKNKGNCNNLFSFGDNNIPSIRTESGHIKAKSPSKRRLHHSTTYTTT